MPPDLAEDSSPRSPAERGRQGSTGAVRRGSCLSRSGRRKLSRGISILKSEEDPSMHVENEWTRIGSLSSPDGARALSVGMRNLSRLSRLTGKSTLSPLCEATDTARVETRNFAIELLQRISGDSTTHIPPEELEGRFTEFARAKREAASHPARRGDQVLYVLPEELVELVSTLLSPDRPGRKGLARGRARASAVGPRALTRGGEMDEGDQSFTNAAALRKSVLNLFYAVDTGSTGKVSWQALLSFLIDATMQGRVGSAAADIHQFNMTRVFMPPDFSPMGRVQYVPKIQRLLILHENYGVRLVGCSDCGVADRGNLIPVPGRPLCAAYVDAYKMIATASADLHLRIMDTKSLRTRAAVKCEESQVCMAWSDRWRRLFSAGREGHVTQWTQKFFRVSSHGEEIQVNDDMDSAENPNISMRLEMGARTQPHRSPIREILFLPLDGYLVSASLDPGLTIQDPARFSDPKTAGVITRFDGFKSGLLSAAFSRDYGLVLGAGYQREVMAWPVSSGRQPPLVLLDKQTPHTMPVVSLHAVDGTAQVHSLDTGGLLKIWDIRSFGCVQSIWVGEPAGLMHCGLTAAQVSMDKGMMSEHQSMVYLPEERRIVVNTRRRFVASDYCHEAENRHEDTKSTADSRPIAAVCYMADSQLILTASGCRVRVWDIKRGQLNTSYENLQLLPNEEISAMAVDAAERRFFVGTNLGRVSAHTTASGGLVASSRPCQGEEVQFLVWMSLRSHFHYLLCGGWAGSTVCLALSQESSSAPVVRLSSSWFGRSVASSKCMGTSADLLFAAVGHDNERFSLWRFDDSGGHDDFSVSAVCQAIPLFPSSAHSPRAGSGLETDPFRRESTTRGFSFRTQSFVLKRIQQRERSASMGGFAAGQLQLLRGGGSKDVTCVAFLANLPILFIAAASGVLQLWRLKRQVPFLIAEWEAEGFAVHSSHAVQPAVSIAAYSVPNALLYTGDEKGAICVYPLSRLFELLGLDSNCREVGTPPDPEDVPAYALSAVRPAVQAHDLALKSLVCCTRPYSIVISSGGLDRKVRLWSPLLNPIGFLDPYVAGGTFQLQNELLLRIDQRHRDDLEEAKNRTGVPQRTPSIVEKPTQKKKRRSKVGLHACVRRGIKSCNNLLSQVNLSTLPVAIASGVSPPSSLDSSEEMTSPPRRTALLAATGAAGPMVPQQRSPQQLGTENVMALARADSQVGALASARKRTQGLILHGGVNRVIDRADQPAVLDLLSAHERWGKIEQAMERDYENDNENKEDTSLFGFFLAQCQKRSSREDTHLRTRRRDRLVRDRRRKRAEEARLRLKKEEQSLLPNAWETYDRLRDMNSPPSSPEPQRPPKEQQPTAELTLPNPYLRELRLPHKGDPELSPTSSSPRRVSPRRWRRMAHESSSEEVRGGSDDDDSEEILRHLSKTIDLCPREKVNELPGSQLPRPRGPQPRLLPTPLDRLRGGRKRLNTPLQGVRPLSRTTHRTL
eukprot:Hpha_TRINITY_DN16873_c4_g1::TRINITY_DN16873_c4_g1_i1::g.149905::m.149905